MATHVDLKAVEEFLRDKTYPKGILKDKRKKSNFRKACKNFSIVNGDLMYKEKRIPVPNEVMKQIGIDLCTLPEVDGFKQLIVCIDYFSKWSEAKAVKNKSAPTVTKFLYEIICQHGCMRIQINDQGKEFVNEVSENLHEMTGTEQRITSAYHPQSNGLCERQNRIIKDSLVKVLEEKPKVWPNIMMIQTLLKRLMKKTMRATKTGNNKRLVRTFLNVTKSHAIDAFYSISRTCKRFQSVMEGKKDEILPMVHINFPENVFQNLPRRANKIKLSVNKLLKFFGSCSGVIECVSKAIGKKLWRSAWLLIAKRKHNWFIIERAFWKQRQNIQSVNLLQQSDIIDEVTEEPWLRIEMYILKKEDQHLLLSKDAWLNDRIMDAAQKLICKEIGTDESYQSVLNSEKKTIDPFHPLSQEHFQLLHDGANHWFLSFCSNGRVQVCDNLCSSLTRSSRKSIRSLYEHCVADGGEQIVAFLPVQKQPDGHNCGPFAIAYAAEILDGRSPSEAVFDVNKMREHLITCLEMQRLTPFPKVSSQ